MKAVWKIIFYDSLIFIILNILTALILKITPLSFESNYYENEFIKIFGLWLPVAILLSLSGLGFTKQKDKIIAIRLAITILMAVFVFFGTLFYAFGAGMCTWTTTEVLFLHKTDSSQKIVKRGFGCGATDSTPAIIDTFKTKEVMFLFIYVTEVNIRDIDKKTWTRINKK